MQTKVGIGVIVFKEDVSDPMVLMGRRSINARHGAGELSFPGGKLEYKEDPLDCAKRELLEETNLEVSDIRELCFTHDIWEDKELHYITLFYTAIVKDSSKLKNTEPDKCDGWDWYNVALQTTVLKNGLIIPKDSLFKPADRILDKRSLLIGHYLRYKNWEI